MLVRPGVWEVKAGRLLGCWKSIWGWSARSACACS